MHRLEVAYRGKFAYAVCTCGWTGRARRALYSVHVDSERHQQEAAVLAEATAVLAVPIPAQASRDAQPAPADDASGVDAGLVPQL